MHHSRVCSGIDVNMLTVLTTTCHWLVYLAYFLIILSEVTPTRTYIKNDCRQATPSCIFSLGGILFVHPWFILLVFITALRIAGSTLQPRCGVSCPIQACVSPMFTQ